MMHPDATDLLALDRSDPDGMRPRDAVGLRW
jgi:hypothetical protein